MNDKHVSKEVRMQEVNTVRKSEQSRWDANMLTQSFQHINLTPLIHQRPRGVTRHGIALQSYPNCTLHATQIHYH